MATATSIQQTFAAAQIAVETAQVERLAEQLRRQNGDLERVICELANDEATADLNVALAYKAALQRQADPLYLAKRLRREAADLLHHSNQSIEDAADYAGKAAARRLRAEHLPPGMWRDAEMRQADEDEARALAIDGYAAKLSSDAAEKSEAAAQIEAAIQRRKDLAGMFSDIARPSNSSMKAA